MVDIPEHVSVDRELPHSHADGPGGRVRSSVVVNRIHASHQEGPA
jgi:hypothetical protein